MQAACLLLNHRGADVSAAVANLDLPEYAWAGQLADFLPSPLGFGNDFVKLPFDKGAAATAEAFILSVASNAVGVVDVLKSFLSGNAEGINTTLNVLLQGFIKPAKTDQVIDGVYSVFYLTISWVVLATIESAAAAVMTPCWAMMVMIS